MIVSDQQPNLQLTITERTHSQTHDLEIPVLSTFGPNILWQGKVEQLNPVTHSDRYICINLYKQVKKLTALYGNVRQEKNNNYIICKTTE